jgi:hypothetical protein
MQEDNRGSQQHYRHGFSNGPHYMTPPSGPSPFQWQHPGGQPMPPFLYPLPWHFNPYNHWPPHPNYVQHPPSHSK